MKIFGKRKNIKLSYLSMEGIEEIFIEKGKRYEEYMQMLRDMHRHSLNNDLSMILNFDDWIMSQLFCFHIAFKHLQEDLK